MWIEVLICSFWSSVDCYGSHFSSSKELCLVLGEYISNIVTLIVRALFLYSYCYCSCSDLNLSSSSYFLFVCTTCNSQVRPEKHVYLNIYLYLFICLRCIETCFKELAHVIVGSGKSQICRAGQRLKTQVEFLCMVFWIEKRSPSLSIWPACMIPNRFLLARKKREWLLGGQWSTWATWLFRKLHASCATVTGSGMGMVLKPSQSELILRILL